MRTAWNAERISLMKKIDFEDYLQDKFIRDNPYVLDDDIPDAFSDWISDLDPNELIEMANDWVKTL